MSWSAVSTGNCTWSPPPCPRRYQPLRLCLLSSPVTYDENWCKWTPPPYSPTSPLQLGPRPRSGGGGRSGTPRRRACHCAPACRVRGRVGRLSVWARPSWHLWPSSGAGRKSHRTKAVGQKSAQHCCSAYSFSRFFSKLKKSIYDYKIHRK
jgi:hypothetical protein